VIFLGSQVYAYNSFLTLSLVTPPESHNYFLKPQLLSLSSTLSETYTTAHKISPQGYISVIASLTSPSNSATLLVFLMLLTGNLGNGKGTDIRSKVFPALDPIAEMEGKLC
jgi:hypothetical protein